MISSSKHSLKLLALRKSELAPLLAVVSCQYYAVKLALERIYQYWTKSFAILNSLPTLTDDKGNQRADVAIASCGSAHTHVHAAADESSA